YMHTIDIHSFPTRRSSDLRAFIKEYANAVGLNPSELLEEHKSEVPSTEENEIEYTRLQRSNREKRRGRSNLFNFSFIPTLIVVRSEEHTSELQSRFDLVCR